MALQVLLAIHLVRLVAQVTRPVVLVVRRQLSELRLVVGLEVPVRWERQSTVARVGQPSSTQQQMPLSLPLRAYHAC